MSTKNGDPFAIYPPCWHRIVNARRMDDILSRSIEITYIQFGHLYACMDCRGYTNSPIQCPKCLSTSLWNVELVMTAMENKIEEQRLSYSDDYVTEVACV